MARGEAVGNRDKLRAFRKASEDAALWEAARTQRRALGECAGVPGSGRVLCQIVHAPSSGANFAWDLRRSDAASDGVQVFRSNVAHERWQPYLIGYEPMDADGALLKTGYDRLLSLALPIAPLFNNMGGIDRETFGLSLFGDLYSECRFRWWSDPPPNWRPMTTIVDELIAHLRDRTPGGELPMGP